jgi:RNA polymerase sigma-32 factor
MSSTLQLYSAALGRLPVMSAAEQSRLTRRYARTGDPRVAERLVLGNLRLVVKIARRLGGGCESDFMDLIQEGNAGLIQAVKRFDPARGVRLSSYAVWWIRAFIIRHIMETSRSVKFSSTREGRRRFFARTLPEPDVRLDAASGLAGRLAADERCRPDVAVEEREQVAAVHAAVAAFGATLDPRRRAVFAARLLSERPPTLRTLGRRFGVSSERARQLEHETVARLRAFALTPSLSRFAGEGDWRG